ncbi:MAG: hypothetical protein WA004_19965 [Saprospiraceae bacterium]
MKFFLNLLMAVFFALPAASAQMDGGEVPLAIRNDFEQRHPDAEEVFWERWERGFKASYYEKGLSKEQFFTAAGQPVYGCTYLEAYELPKAVQEFLRNRFSGNYMPSVVLRMERPNRSVLYRVHLDTREGFLELVFDESGCLRGENLESYETGQN